MKQAFITGANVGQANLLTKRLAARGWHVFAGVLPGAPTDLVNGPNVTLVDQDVSSDESVQASAALVQKALGEGGLDLLMNVAGVANIAVGVLEGVDINQVRRIFEINAFGHLRVIQAMLPMLRKARPPARIVNYSSGAIIVNPVGAGSYNMTKHAIHGLTLTLRHELAPFGIQVTSIIPGGVMTGMSTNAHENTKASWAKQPENIRRVYEPYLYKTMTQVLPDMLEQHGNTPEYAVDETMKVLDKTKWKPCYYVGRDVKPIGLMRRLFSDSTLESLLRSQYKIPAYKG
jgi:NAD(P)-dependent dehydrogenase (short-subunit alcohol dehydrogenase family)